MRRARLNIPGITHHLIWRFVERRWFVASATHRNQYLRWLGRALEQSDWRCLAYAVMSNHIHVAAVAGNEPLAAWSRRVNLPFAQWINESLDRIGPVFADRARDYAVGPANVASVLAYIHNNPVRAGVVDHARDSDWTSHRSYLSASAPGWLHVDEALELARHDRRSFDALVENQPNDPERPPDKRIRSAASRYGQINTATPFATIVPLVTRPFGRIRPDPRRIVDLVCAALAVHPGEVASRRRHPTLVVARTAIVHCGLASGITGSDIASALGLSQQGVSWIAHRQKRPNFCDDVLSQLAREVQASVIL